MKRKRRKVDRIILQRPAEVGLRYREGNGLVSAE